MAYSRAAGTIRGTVAQNITDATGVIDLDEEKHPYLSRVLNGKGLADVYQFGMSIQDSAAVVGLAAINPALGKVGTVLLSSSAGTQTMLDAVDRGATDEQALQLGILSGAFELLFETYELDTLLNADDVMWRNITNQALTETFGESATEISNMAADYLIMGKNSNYEQNIVRYLAENPTWNYEQAAKQAMIDSALQVAEAGFGGLISGGAMGGGVTVTQNVYNAIQAEVAESLKGKAIPSWKIDTLAEAIVGRVNDQELTRTQREILSFEQRRPSVLNIINDLIQKKANGVDSAQNRVYDGSGIRDGVPNEEKAGLQNLSDQSVDAFGDRDNRTATEASAIDQSKGTSSTGGFDGGLDTSIKKIDKFVEGTKSFDDVLDDYAKVYADKINSNRLWSWEDTIPGGENLTPKQRSIIKQQAVASGLIPDIKVTKVEGMRYGFADFESADVVIKTHYLPENMWKMGDAEQFKWLNEQNGGSIEGYTWHHTETPGEMQLVPTGIHNITTHNGGRTAGMWADSPR